MTAWGTRGRRAAQKTVECNRVDQLYYMTLRGDTDVINRAPTENLMMARRITHFILTVPAATALMRNIGGDRVACPRDAVGGARKELNVSLSALRIAVLMVMIGRLTVKVVTCVATRGGMLGRGVTTHPPCFSPNRESMALLLLAAFMPARRRGDQAMVHAQSRYVDLRPRAPHWPHVQASAAALETGSMEIIGRVRLARNPSGCGHLSGSTSPTLDGEGAQTSRAQAGIGLATALKLDVTPTAFHRTRRYGSATLVAS